MVRQRDFVMINLLLFCLIVLVNSLSSTGGSAYPSDLFSKNQIKYFGWIFYFIGIFYMFLGISFVTHNYINPSIDIIKVKGVLSSDTMNATLLAMTNSAAESFIIMNSIFFGNSDIGIYTVVGETAFYTLII